MIGTGPEHVAVAQQTLNNMSGGYCLGINSLGSTGKSKWLAVKTC